MNKTKDKPSYNLFAWAFIHLNDWHNHYMGKGQCESHRGVVGWCVVVSDEALPISLDANHESKWVVFVYRKKGAKEPFAIIPGCKVYSAHILDKEPDFKGFCTTTPPPVSEG